MAVVIIIVLRLRERSQKCYGDLGLTVVDGRGSVDESSWLVNLSATANSLTARGAHVVATFRGAEDMAAGVDQILIHHKIPEP
ncbi:hypothetical protein KC356_g81 [Hortaea werneckii]|nr:hypothetical protein KC356_g81 [Hortaea werneckii]